MTATRLVFAGLVLALVTPFAVVWAAEVVRDDANVGDQDLRVETDRAEYERATAWSDIARLLGI